MAKLTTNPKKNNQLKGLVLFDKEIVEVERLVEVQVPYEVIKETIIYVDKPFEVIKEVKVQDLTKINELELSLEDYKVSLCLKEGETLVLKGLAEEKDKQIKELCTQLNEVSVGFKEEIEQLNSKNSKLHKENGNLEECIDGLKEESLEEIKRFKKRLVIGSILALVVGMLVGRVI